mmetsp:Transcript_16074/g.27136  ORF Transcript_16074/g.27136 Transcript_16074/m.27136 type:complete len:257 (+) Transcript_16074:1249-2019(+)
MLDGLTLEEPLRVGFGVVLRQGSLLRARVEDQMLLQTRVQLPKFIPVLAPQLELYILSFLRVFRLDLVQLLPQLLLQLRLVGHQTRQGLLAHVVNSLFTLVEILDQLNIVVADLLNLVADLGERALGDGLLLCPPLVELGLELTVELLLDLSIQEEVGSLRKNRLSEVGLLLKLLPLKVENRARMVKHLPHLVNGFEALFDFIVQCALVIGGDFDSRLEHILLIHQNLLSNLLVFPEIVNKVLGLCVLLLNGNFNS